MIVIEYRGNKYKLVLNKALFNCVNVLFMGYIFINGKNYKKYINCNKDIYLVEV